MRPKWTVFHLTDFCHLHPEGALLHKIELPKHAWKSFCTFGLISLVRMPCSHVARWRAGPVRLRSEKRIAPTHKPAAGRKINFKTYYMNFYYIWLALHMLLALRSYIVRWCIQNSACKKPQCFYWEQEANEPASTGAANRNEVFQSLMRFIHTKPG